MFFDILDNSLCSLIVDVIWYNSVFRYNWHIRRLIFRYLLSYMYSDISTSRHLTSDKTATFAQICSFTVNFPFDVTYLNALCLSSLPCFINKSKAMKQMSFHGVVIFFFMRSSILFYCNLCCLCREYSIVFLFAEMDTSLVDGERLHFKTTWFVLAHTARLLCYNGFTWAEHKSTTCSYAHIFFVCLQAIWIYLIF